MRNLSETVRDTTHQMNLKEHGLWSHLKSSIHPEMVLVGRPHGGVGFVFKSMQGIVYKPIDIECDRMMGLQLINNGKPVLNILGVYLPYCDGSREQIALYSKTLDIHLMIVPMFLVLLLVTWMAHFHSTETLE